MTQVLARKWRPKTFAELVGQEHVVRALTNALSEQRLHHAYLFTGTRGCGKTTLARIVAKSLNCETGVTATPCGKCPACTEIDAGRFVDLIELDAASNTQVDNMRELLENAMYAPTAGRYKVYIIDEVHMLSRNAFNAMLKTLEEPPEHVKFVLATTDPQKIPVTVLSRCLQFNLKQIPQAQIQGRLQHVLNEEGIPAEPQALALIARGAQGSLRDALSLLDQAIAHGAGKVDVPSTRAMLGTVDQTYLHAILRALAQGDGAKLVAEADAMAERSLSFEMALQELGVLLHRLALVQKVPQIVADDDPDAATLRELSGLFGAEDLQLYYQIAVQARNEIGLAPDEYAGFTMALLRMLAFAPAPVGGAPKRAESPPRAQAPTRGQTRASSGSDPGFAATPAQKPVSDQTRETTGPRPAASADFGASWSDIVDRIGVVGMAAMLAKNCEMTRLTPERIELTLPKAHERLLDGSHKERLKAALQKHFGAGLHVAIAVGASNGNSPAQLAQRDREREQEEANAAIESDPFVQALVDELGGQVQSIKPLQSQEPT
ncbi:MAG TPA: DNA polymerase III subunit gamma/tau [Burkholderiales bacterium]|nr:DNA polymerase III subunit gamma/tau [Burkholderiales bacterium]